MNKAIHTCFRKIRVTQNVERKQSKIDELMNAKKLIKRKRKLEQEDEENIDEIKKEIIKEIADREYEKLENVMGNLDLDTNTNIWKEMRKAYPSKSNPLPTGVNNAQGKLITNPKEKRKVTLDHFQNRMRKRDIKDDTKEVDDLNTKLFNKQLYLAKLNKRPPFEIKELEKVLKSLKPGKSKDPDDYICELFKDGVIGIDLKIFILMMMNKIKEDIKVPECLKKANITILHKKNCKLDLNNWRGVFVCSVLRTILMKLVYERTYEQVSSTMTDAQIGARKKKSVRNHIFVLNSIISDVMSSKKKPPIDLNIMDFKQMFDGEELKSVLNAFFEAGVKDDMFSIINEANATVKFAVKTPTGLTEERVIRNKIMQGDVLSPLMSSSFLTKT